MKKVIVLSSLLILLFGTGNIVSAAKLPKLSKLPKKIPTVRFGGCLKEDFPTSGRSLFTAKTSPAIKPANISAGYGGCLKEDFPTSSLSAVKPAGISSSVKNLLARKVVQQQAKAPKAISFSEEYTSLPELAHDVAAFYHGKGGQRLQDAFGREFVRYDLPVDEIVYRPYSEAEATVFTADKYCVMFNPANLSGEVLLRDGAEMKRYSPIEEEE